MMNSVYVFMYFVWKLYFLVSHRLKVSDNNGRSKSGPKVEEVTRGYRKLYNEIRVLKSLYPPSLLVRLLT
jgi:hypothetical protein